jgi:phosphonate transport system substrate-binding protein
MVERKVVEKSKLRSIYKSQTFPTSGYGHVYNLKPELAAKVKEAFFSFSWADSELKKEFKEEDKFVPITYKQHWDVIRKIDKASDVSYTCK